MKKIGTIALAALNQQGKAIGLKELSGKELMVFYSITTRSLSPQTPPTKNYCFG